LLCKSKFIAIHGKEGCAGELEAFAFAGEAPANRSYFMESIVVRHIVGPVVENLLMAFRVAVATLSNLGPRKSLVRRSNILPRRLKLFADFVGDALILMCVTDEDELDHTSLFTSAKS
jgi:hypothetical protein